MGRTQVQSGLDNLSLEAESAGIALGCRYSSSDEYEAALIAERRSAGAYGTPFWRSGLMWTAMMTAALLLIVAAQ